MLSHSHYQNCCRLRAALARFREIAFKINDMLPACRAAGVLVVHAPSDCVGGYDGADVMPMYADHPARKWVAELPAAEPETHFPQAVPLYPIDSSDGGCDSSQAVPIEKGWKEKTARGWVKETDAIEIEAADALIDGNDGVSLFNLCAAKGITTLLYCGVATNMCVMARGTAIVASKSKGLETILLRDLTDTMYNPEMPPYLESHEAGTELFIQFLEKDFSDVELPDDKLEPAFTTGYAGSPEGLDMKTDATWSGVPTCSRMDLMRSGVPS